MSYDRMLKTEADLDAETRDLRRIADRDPGRSRRGRRRGGRAVRSLTTAATSSLRSCAAGRTVSKFLRKAKAELEAEAEQAEIDRREQMRAEGREPRDATGTAGIRSSPSHGRNGTSPTRSRRS